MSNVPVCELRREGLISTGLSRVPFTLTLIAQKNDPNDARSVAIAALRTDGLARLSADEHAQVLKLLAKRHRERR